MRLRIINGMPGKRLAFVAGRQEILVEPGEFAVLAGQPATARYLAKVDGESIPLLMRQEGLIRNAMIVFFLKSGRPAFMRAFENNADSNRKREELEKKNAMNPERTIAELKELRALTSDENGAQRVAFTATWAKARAWLRAKLEELPAEIHRDEAGNVWATLRGESEQALLIGGHIDSVPNGGWLDGCLNMLAGVEILRRINAQYAGKPPLTVRLVDWADEEGARFGKSLFGSSACSGYLDMDEARA